MTPSNTRPLSLFIFFSYFAGEAQAERFHDSNRPRYIAIRCQTTRPGANLQEAGATSAQIPLPEDASAMTSTGFGQVMTGAALAAAQ